MTEGAINKENGTTRGEIGLERKQMSSLWILLFSV